MNPFARSKGFTVMELLVVIALIGMLSSIILTGLNSSRAKGRDASRVSDMKQLQLALSLYYNDKGYYPPSSSAVLVNITPALNVLAAAPSYITPLPKDPGFTYSYQYAAFPANCNNVGAACTSYILKAELETPSGTGGLSPGTYNGIDCTRTSSVPYDFCVQPQ